MNKCTARALFPAVVGAGALGALLLVGGCQDELGTGGTGELVIPVQQLHRVAPLDLRNSIATTRPSPPTTQPAAEMTLSIEDSRRMALANNLDLRVELFNPSIARTSLTEAEAQFEAVFSGSLNAATSRTPIFPASVSPRTDEVTPDTGLLVPLRTGGSIHLDLPVDYVHTHFTGPSNTGWNTSPSFSILQPLLRGAGLYVNTQGIRVSFYEYQRAQTTTKLEVIRVLSDVDRAYWQLYAARQTLIVRKKEYDSAVAQLERARRQGRAGVVAEVDVVRAESGVADKVENILIAENDVRQRQRALKRLLNDSTLPLDADTTLVPATTPAAFPFDLDAQKLTATALRQRMELLDAELLIAEQAAAVLVARNGLLPLVAIQYSYGVTGLGPTAGIAFDQVSRERADVQHLGLELQVPIGNEAARSALRRAMLQRLQALATREQRVLQVRQEIADAVDTLRTDWQRIVAARERVVLSARTLDVEIRQFNQGLRTSTDVLIAQTDLASAQLAEVSAVSDYQIAQVDIAVATGTVLGASHVDWQAAPLPKVPRY